ncbi:hypothetical protein ACK32P_04435 [Aeromonas dhakensis]|uniref:hypothetical protein n=1 Tax=Aeromonas dhakensis TaxID=196024 RepID=UPI0039864DEE
MVGKRINSNIEAAWRWMCQQDSFDLLEVAAGSPLKLRNIYLVVRGWLASGHLRCVYQKPFGRSFSFRGSRYQVVATAGDPEFGSGNRKTKQRQKRRIHRKTVQQKMWNTMKISRFFTLSDLAITSGVDDAGASTYTTILIRAGYVRLVDKIERFKVKGDQNRYQLIRDTGRFAPMVRAKQGGCWDQNEQRFYQFDMKETPHGHVA